MKNKMREKIIAGIMLSAFVLTNSFTSVIAVESYGYGDANAKPAIRSGGYSSLSLTSNIDIPNGDSSVNLSLRDADVTQVLRMFADQAGMNIIFSPDVAGNVTMDLVDIPLKEALDLVVKTNKLYYDIKANTLVVSTEDAALSLADRGKNLSIVPVKYVDAVALSHFLNKSVFSPKGQGSLRPGMSKGFIVATNPASNELIVTGTEYDVEMVKRVVEQFDKKPALTTFKVNHTTPAEMAGAVCSSLLPSMHFVNFDNNSSGGAAGIPTGFASDESGSSADGGSVSSISVGGGKLACVMSSAQKTEETTSGENGEEETFSLESLPLLNLSVSYFPTLGTVQIVGGSEHQLEMIREYIATNDKKTPQAYLEVQIVSLSEAGSKVLDNTWQFMSKNFSFNAGGGSGFSTSSLYPVFFAGRGYGLLDPNSFHQAEYEDGKLVKPEGYDKVGNISKWGSSPQLVYSVNYIIENNKGRVLANPRVLLTSGQPSTIDLSSDYISKVTTQYLDNGASTAAQVQKEYEIKDDNGIKISIVPFISPDGYVTLDIKPEYKTIAKQYMDKAGDPFATLLQRRDLDLKGVRIKDGETLVIGGMIQETETKQVSKIPFLGDIPVLGMFFRSTGTSKSKEEMVMMLTPQIIIDTEDAVADDTLL